MSDVDGKTGTAREDGTSSEAVRSSKRDEGRVALNEVAGGDRVADGLGDPCTEVDELEEAA